MRYHIEDAIKAKEEGKRYDLSNPRLGFKNFPLPKNTQDKKDLMLLCGSGEQQPSGGLYGKRSRAFNVMIDAFNNEINLTQTNKLAKGVTNQNQSNSSAGSTRIPMGVVEYTNANGIGTILMLEEEDITHQLGSASSPNISPIKTARASDGGEGTEPSGREAVGMSPVMTQRKARQLERERKRQTAIASTSVQMNRWKRLMDPVFSGSASP